MTVLRNLVPFSIDLRNADLFESDFCGSNLTSLEGLAGMAGGGGGPLGTDGDAEGFLDIDGFLDNDGLLDSVGFWDNNGLGDTDGFSDNDCFCGKGCVWDNGGFVEVDLAGIVGDGGGEFEEKEDAREDWLSESPRVS